MNSLTRPHQANLLRSDSSINIDDISYDNKTFNGVGVDSLDAEKKRIFMRFWSLIAFVVREVRFGNNRSMKRLTLLISLNVAYSTTELFTGLITGRVGLVSDSFHLTFGCGLLTFSLFAMAVSRSKPDGIYTYGYKRLEVLAAFTNAVSFFLVGDWFQKRKKMALLLTLQNLLKGQKVQPNPIEQKKKKKYTTFGDFMPKTKPKFGGPHAENLP